MLPKSASGPPKTGQVEAKIGPRPPKLGPRWPSCCHLGSSWARLCASWRQLCCFFSEIRRYIRRKLKKISQELLRTFIFVFLEPPDDDFHHFPRCVFLVFVSVVHLRFTLPFFFQIRFAPTRLGFFRTRPDTKLCYAGCFAQRAQLIKSIFVFI